MRCSEPRAGVRSKLPVFASHPLAAWHFSQGSRSLILYLVRL